MCLRSCPPFGAKVDDDGAGLHGLDLFGVDQTRCALAGDGGGGDDQVRAGNMVAQRLADLLFLVIRQFAGIAALTGGIDAGIDEFRTQRLRLFLGLGADVIAFGDGAKALGGGQGLKPGHAEAHDQNLCGAQGADGRGHHGQDLGHVNRAHQDGVIPGQRGLAGQGVHGLCTGNAGHQFHGETGDLPVPQGLHQIRIVAAVDESNEDGAGLHGLHRFQRRRLDGEDDVGIGDKGVAVRREGDVLIGAVGVGRCDACARFHGEGDPQRGQFLGDLRNEGDAAFPAFVAFFQD